MPTTKEGQLAQAILGTLTNDPAMAQAGALPLQYRDRVQNMGQGFYERGGQFGRVPGYEQAVEAQARRNLAARRQALEESLVMDLEKQRRLVEIPTRSDASKARELASYLPRLAQLGTELVQGGFEIPTGTETTASAIRAIPYIGETTAAFAERSGMDPAAVRWLAKGRQAESDVVRLAAGANLTNIETQNAKMWSPWATGLTPGERLDRLENLYNKFGKQAASFMNAPWQDMEFERSSAPTAAAPALPAPAATAAPAMTPSAPVPAGPKVGTVEDGYKFLGGDPSNPDSWEQVK